MSALHRYEACPACGCVFDRREHMRVLPEVEVAALDAVGVEPAMGDACDPCWLKSPDGKADRFLREEELAVASELQQPSACDPWNDPSSLLSGDFSSVSRALGFRPEVRP